MRFPWQKKKPEPQVNVLPSCVYNCLKEKCPMWFSYVNRYVETDRAGQAVMEPVMIDGEMVQKPKIREVPAGKCAIAAIPEQVMALREVVAFQLGVNQAKPKTKEQIDGEAT